MKEPSDLDRTGGEIDWPAHIERTNKRSCIY